MGLYTKKGQAASNKDAIDVIAKDTGMAAASSQMYGSNSSILVGDNGDIFKVPHSPFNAKRVGNEIKILQRLRGTDALVPQVTYESDEYVLFGMTPVAGELMTPDKIRNLPADKLESLARSIGAELAKIEKFFSPRPKDFGPEFDGEQVDRVPYPSNLSQAFKIIKAENLRGEEGRFLANILKAYHDKYKDYQGDRRVLSHNDLGGNIFFDPENPDKITAIIDFEIAGFRLPEEGFREMWKKFPASFLGFVLNEYGKQRGQEVPVADVAAALLNQFLVKGGHDVRAAVNKFREGFPELEVFANGASEPEPEQSTARPKSRGWLFGLGRGRGANA